MMPFGATCNLCGHMELSHDTADRAGYEQCSDCPSGLAGPVACVDCPTGVCQCRLCPQRGER